MAYNSCVTYFIENLTDTTIQAHGIKAVLSIINWTCRKVGKNHKKIKKKVTHLEVP